MIDVRENRFAAPLEKRYTHAIGTLSGRALTAIANAGVGRFCCLISGLWLATGAVFGSGPGEQMPIMDPAARVLHGTPSGAGVIEAAPGFPRGTDPVWTQRDKLLPSDGVAGVMDHFGWDVALDGDTALSLACEAEGGSSAYVHVRSGDIWKEQAKLTPAPDELRCYSFYQGGVALDGDTAVLGMSLDAVELAGSAFIYTREAGQWTQQAQLVPSDSTVASFFGYSVALDGDTVIVGAPVLSTAYVFTRSGEEWIEQAKLVGTAPPSETAFGWSIDVQGDTAVVSELGNPDLSIPASVHVFIREAGAWTLQAVLAPGDGGDDVEFGMAVALDVDTLAVGASGLTLDGQAAVYVFVRDGEDWTEQTKLIQPPEHPNGNLGRSVTLQGDILITGDEQSNAAYLYARQDDDWSHQTTLAAADGASGRRFGRAVALDGDTAIASIFPVNFLGDGSNGWMYAFDTREPAPAIRLAPAFIDFDEVPVGQPSAPRQVKVENNGGAGLSVSATDLGGSHAADFLLTADSCSDGMVDPGDSCNLEITFLPSALGARTAWLSVSSNAPTVTDTLSLQGTGIPGPPAIRIEPDHLVVAVDQHEIAEETLTIGNAGTVDLEWNVVTDPEADVAGPRYPVRAATLPATRADLRQADVSRVTVAAADDGQGRARSAFSERSQGATSTLTHSVALDVEASNTPRCAEAGSTLANKFLRTFTLPDFGITGGFEITQVSFGIERLTTTAEVTVNVYTLEGDFVFENLTLAASATLILDAQELTRVAVPVSAPIPPGSTIVVELDVPSLAAEAAFFEAGSNSAGETAPSYLAAPGASACNIDQPVTMASLGFPGAHLVMVVTGHLDCEMPAWLAAAPAAGVVPGGASQSLALTLDTAGLAVGEYSGQFCVAANDPSRPTVQVPVLLNVTELPEDAIFRDLFQTPDAR